MKQRVGNAVMRIRTQASQRKRLLLMIGIGLLVVGIVAQIFYPSNRVLPFVTVDDVEVSMWQNADVARVLDDTYRTQPVELFFGKTDTPQVTAKPADIGLVTENVKRVEALSYPWYMRLIPSSVFWYGLLQQPSSPTYSRDTSQLDKYIAEQLGDSCKVQPINASLRAEGNGVIPTKAASGGTCELDDVKTSLQGVSPLLTAPTRLTITMDEIAPDVSDATAEQLAKVINTQLSKGVEVKAGNETIRLDARDVASWLTFTAKDKELQVGVDTAKAKDVLMKTVAPKVAVAAGVTSVKTHDFVETSRVEGAKGRTLNLVGTGDSIAAYVSQRADTIIAPTSVVQPTVRYSRSYSATDTGLSALIEHYAKDHDGVFGVQLIELSGQRRRAGYNESKQFVAASTYKLFVAYGTLKKVESGAWKWSDQVAGGRDMAACFDDMIVKSDNPCAEALLERYGYSNLTRDIRALGLSNSSGFIGDGPKATAADLALFMAMLESNQLPIKSASRDRLIGALKRNVYRQGIPAGTSGTVANKVGFLNGLLHDSSIVYGSGGTYVLVVMTDKSSWATIADLTKKIDTLRKQ